MERPFAAHISEDGRIQTIKDHLEGTANRAKQFGGGFCNGEICVKRGRRMMRRPSLLKIIVSSTMFQSTHPYGVRRAKTLVRWLHDAEFQSTHPHGGRLVI